MRLPGEQSFAMCRGRAPDERTQKKKKKKKIQSSCTGMDDYTAVSEFIFFRSKTDLVYRHEWLCRSGNGHGGSILTPQAENKNCQSVGTCSTWKMQSWLENTSTVAFFTMCIVQQSRSRYRLLPLCAGILTTNGLWGSYLALQDRNKVFVF